MTIDELRLLATYFPDETFSRDVREHDGVYLVTQSTSGSQLHLIGNMPVRFPPCSWDSVNKIGDNRVEVVCGKKHVYVIRMNDSYDIVELASEVEYKSRQWDQWQFGIPGLCSGGGEIEIIDQRHCDVTERRVNNYEVLEESADSRRYLGSCLIVLSLWLFSLMAIDLFSSYLLLFLCSIFFLVGFVPMILEKSDPSYPINRIRGIYKRVRDCDDSFMIGTCRVWPSRRLKRLANNVLRNGKMVAADVCVHGMRVIKIEGLPDPYEDWDHRKYEPLAGNIYMMIAVGGPLALLVWLTPALERTVAQSWMTYACATLFIAYGVNLIRRMWQRR
ncbi:hypothetical protein [Pseudomonas sp. NA-150]|uniref:hypothetical protein n=1 Tax=Pseudomonas sp. NA-150 TaxID=3367525 RepID=UPI0037C58049